MRGYHETASTTKCIGCGCTELEPCEPPCAWSRTHGALCTTCEAIVTNVLAAFFPKRTKAKARR